MVKLFRLLVENLYLSSPFFLWTIWNLEDKKIIVTFSAPKKAMSDKPNSNITKLRKKAYKNYCSDEQISMRNALIFIQVPSPYSLRKYEELISLENFFEDILDLKRFSISFYYLCEKLREY